MPTVHFTGNLQRHIDSPSKTVSGQTLAQVLEKVFAENHQLKGYIVDDQQRLRPHMLIAIDGEIQQNLEQLDLPVKANAEIYVMQALSGG